MVIGIASDAGMMIITRQSGSNGKAVRRSVHDQTLPCDRYNQSGFGAASSFFHAAM
jgi:hypothetical protein